MTAQANHAPITAKQYIIIGAWLACLMLLGVVLSELPIPRLTVVGIVLALSTIKALLVGAFFMHLKFDDRFLTLVAVVPIPMGILLLATLLLDKPFLR